MNVADGHKKILQSEPTSGGRKILPVGGGREPHTQNKKRELNLPALPMGRKDKPAPGQKERKKKRVR